MKPGSDSVRAGKYSEEPSSNERPWATATCIFAFKEQPRVSGIVDTVTVNYSNGHDSFEEVDGATGPGTTTQRPEPGSSITARTTAVPDLGVCPPDEATCPWTALL